MIDLATLKAGDDVWMLDERHRVVHGKVISVTKKQFVAKARWAETVRSENFPRWFTDQASAIKSAIFFIARDSKRDMEALERRIKDNDSRISALYDELKAIGGVEGFTLGEGK